VEHCIQTEACLTSDRYGADDINLEDIFCDWELCDGGYGVFGQLLLAQDRTALIASAATTFFTEVPEEALEAKAIKVWVSR
jgi:hypothetical protein